MFDRNFIWFVVPRFRELLYGGELTDYFKALSILISNEACTLPSVLLLKAKKKCKKPMEHCFLYSLILHSFLTRVWDESDCLDRHYKH